MSQLTILGRVTSINVRKVLWAADEIGLDYVREDWGLPLRDPTEPPFLRLNPNAQVPVIIEGDFVLWESNAIIRYLAQQHRSGLLPAAPRAQAVMEQWLGWQATDLNASWGYAVSALIRKVPGYDDPERLRTSTALWNRRMQVLEDRLVATGSYAAGESFSLADIAIGLAVHRWRSAPFEKPELPAVQRYYEQLLRREAGAPYLGPETL
ncbi:MAG TPA: glutathione S-transferase family protein [Devosiaceae bacterium]|jgi:glutathione S-transferase|nr:glutathione S-transferase family protein [Devosiaceae bacterium]